MRKKKSPVPVAAGLLAAAVLVGIGGFALNRYAPTGEHMDKMEYYGLTDENQAALVVDDQVLKMEDNFRSTPQIKADHPELSAFDEFGELLSAIRGALN